MNITIKPKLRTDLDKYFTIQINKHFVELDEFDAIDLNDTPPQPPTPSPPPNQTN